MTDHEIKEKLESLKKMRLSATMLQVGFAGENLSEFIQCQVELDALAERLQAEHGDLVTAQQCEEAKGSLDAFVALIDQAQERLNLSGKTPRDRQNGKHPCWDEQGSRYQVAGNRKCMGNGFLTPVSCHLSPPALYRRFTSRILSS